MDFRTTFAAVDTAVLGMVGDTAVLDITGDGSALVSAVGEFDAPWLSPQLGSLRTDVLEPMFTLQSIGEPVGVDLSRIVKGITKLQFAGKTYLVVDVKPDGTGLAVLPLRPLD